MYKLLILDYGGVYSFEYDAGSFDRIMKNTFGVVPDEQQRTEISPHSHSLGRGDIDSSDYVKSVAQILKCGQIPDATLFEEETLKTALKPNPLMQELVQKVRTAGVKVSLLSDMYLFEAEHTRPLGRYEGFDFVALSAEEGMTKKEPAYFQQTLDHFGVEPKDALFLDDTRKNTDVADSIGIPTMLVDKSVYIEASQLVSEVYKQLGISSQ